MCFTSARMADDISCKHAKGTQCRTVSHSPGPLRSGPNNLSQAFCLVVQPFKAPRRSERATASSVSGLTAACWYRCHELSDVRLELAKRR